MNLVQQLKDALRDARLSSEMYQFIEDDGTSNFDHPVLMKPEGMSSNDVEEAFKLANIQFDKETSGMWKGYYHILGVCSGQGSRRTRMAEEFADHMIQKGYFATVYYQMD